MTINEWRSNPELVKKASVLLRDPFVALLLETVSLDIEAGYHTLIGSSPDDKAMVLGSVLGHRDCLEKIRRMGVLLPATRDVEATFAPET